MADEKRFTARELRSGSYVLMDGGNTMEPLEVQAEALNLLERIARVLEAQHTEPKPGDTLRRTRRAYLEESIGTVEALAARHRAGERAGERWSSGAPRAQVIKEFEDVAQALRAELVAFEAAQS